MKADTTFARSSSGGGSSSSYPVGPCGWGRIGSAEPEAFAAGRVPLPEALVSSNFPSSSVRRVRERFRPEALGVAASDGRSSMVTGVGSVAMSSRSFW